MSENAELLSFPDEESIRIKLIDWLKRHNIQFYNDMETEELRQLYINAECGGL